MSVRRLLIGLCLCVILVSALAGCAATTATLSPSNLPAADNTPVPIANFTPLITPAAPGEVAATVNGKPIMREDYEKEVAQFQAAMVSQGMSFSGEEGKPLAEQVRAQVMEAMIEEAVIAQAGEKMGITATDEVLQQRISADVQSAGGADKFDVWLQKNSLTREQYEQVMRSQIVTDEIVRRLGTQVPDKARQVHLRQILVDDEDVAAQARKSLDGGADFATLAKKVSQDEESREQGGDRGFVPVGMGFLDPEVEEAIAGLGPGQIAGPIAGPTGYYVVQVVAVEDQRDLSPEMRQELMRNAFALWMEEEKGKATIERLIE